MRLPVAITLFFSVLVWGQKPSEIGLVSDNDLYSSPKNDKYYTSGVELYYRYLGKSRNEAVAKKITEFRAGQYIYNPQTVEAEDVRYHDRPFAGYLFAQAGIHTFFKDESVLKAAFQVGVIGPESYAEEVQEQLHKLVGYPTVAGWEYQIPSTLGLQAQLFFSDKIFAQRYKEKIDFHFTGEFNGGTVWQSMSLGLLSRISLKRPLLPVYESNLYGAALSHDRQAKMQQQEFYLFLNPSVQYMRYDATIQGGFFSDETLPVTFPLIPFRFNAAFGIKYRKNNWNLSYAVNYRGKELSNNVITGYYYGSIGIGYFL